MHIKWGALGEVFLVGLGVTVVVVVLFSFGVNALSARAEALEGGSESSRGPARPPRRRCCVSGSASWWWPTGST